MLMPYELTTNTVLPLCRWEDDAETRCEALITEALSVAPDQPDCLQTLASVRISQTRIDDARAALSRSLELWQDLPPEDPKIPDFPSRISLSRLLMEVQMEVEALQVLERLILEDDESVEAWYLGGWCLYLLAEKEKEESSEEKRQESMVASRGWLKQSLKLYQKLEYEDERLRDHALELVQELQDRGINVKTPPCNIINANEVWKVFNELKRTMPPIRGCIQSSVVLIDRNFDEMTFEEWYPVVECKAAGSWNLHENLPVDVDFQGGIRRIWSQHCAPQVLLNSTMI